jgi:hypothetical protein
MSSAASSLLASFSLSIKRGDVVLAHKGQELSGPQTSSCLRCTPVRCLPLHPAGRRRRTTVFTAVYSVTALRASPALEQKCAREALGIRGIPA